MTTVSIDADIKAKWPQGHSSYSPGSPEELAIIGIDLLVKELGTRSRPDHSSRRYSRNTLPTIWA